ncbi:hypothetical protein NI17_017845 [Thermobifida halotolerans]|uniref:Ketosynthase family 3 (KS3) domain-containing protein n=1 Tax=Thermobifida halotolerans TaxID=483545 RepID=A0AA97LV64_9ACTN|nr:hypothetical protein NI17_017845 [Thermobifida halotolerans]
MSVREEENNVREGVEPIAIVGMGCRFPGGVDSPEELWKFLLDGADGIVEVPDGRWDSYLRSNPENAAAMRDVTRYGGFLPDAAGFDAAFFGITPREAELMDPQQRLLLEVNGPRPPPGGRLLPGRARSGPALHARRRLGPRRRLDDAAPGRPSPRRDRHRAAAVRADSQPGTVPVHLPRPADRTAAQQRRRRPPADRGHRGLRPGAGVSALRGRGAGAG